MKSFKIYINESDYTRFLKMNKNLNDTEIENINSWFADDNPRAGEKFGREYDWQSKKVKNMSFVDFFNINNEYMNTFSQKKKNVKLGGLKGLKKDVDYIEIKLKTKHAKAIIPLNHEASVLLASNRVGTCKCEGKWCISFKKNNKYWKSYVIRKKQVPIMVMTEDTKWCVMALKSGSFHVWDQYDNKESNANTPFTNEEKIPEINIKKDLMNSKLLSLYNEIRDKFFKSKYEILEDLPQTVTDQYYRLKHDIAEYVGIDGYHIIINYNNGVYGSYFTFAEDINSNLGKGTQKIFFKLISSITLEYLRSMNINAVDSDMMLDFVNNLMSNHGFYKPERLLIERGL